MKSEPNPRLAEPRGPTDKVYVVKYRVPGDEGRNPRRMTVNARNQSDAVRAAVATVPGAKVVGGPQELKEGLGDFAKAVGRFLSRCVGRGCLGYARSKVRSRPDSLSHIRKMTTRDIARRVGERLIHLGGAKEDYHRLKTYKPRSPKKRPRTVVRKKR